MMVAKINPAVKEDVSRILHYASERVSRLAGISVRLVPVYAWSIKDDAELKTVVSEVFGVSWDKISGPSQCRNIVAARHSYCYLSRRLFPRKPLINVAEDVGYRDHTTVIHAVATVEDHLKTGDEMVAPKVKQILESINHEA